MRKILSIIILILVLSGFYIQNTSASSTWYFRVTAYYSPLPGQKYYIKWNYWAEKKMNWEWIRWASGKKVFSGMLAAPAKYSFGTKIYLKWLWIWEVADRGGAIVKAWERNFKHDRIDIWVWYWDEGLRRAMYWGNRVIKWNIIKYGNKPSINYKKIPSPTWAIPKTKQSPHSVSPKRRELATKSEFELKLESELKIFNKKIDTKEETKILQEKLTNLWLYNWKLDWNYSNIKNIISSYQLKNKLIKYIWDTWTGYFGPKTRANLKKDYKKYLENIEIENKKIKEFEKNLNLLKIDSEKQAKSILKNIWNVKFWEVSHSVRELQKTLKKLGYFEYKDTAIFWKKTKQAILNYQLDKKIIANIYVPWTWIFWPNTKAQFLNDLANQILWEKISKNTELTQYYTNKKNKVIKNG